MDRGPKWSCGPLIVWEAADLQPSSPFRALFAPTYRGWAVKIVLSLQSVNGEPPAKKAMKRTKKDPSAKLINLLMFDRPAMFDGN